jgi:hypothetical protein
MCFRNKEEGEGEGAIREEGGGERREEGRTESSERSGGGTGEVFFFSNSKILFRRGN